MGLHPPTRDKGVGAKRGEKKGAVILFAPAHHVPTGRRLLHRVGVFQRPVVIAHLRAALGAPDEEAHAAGVVLRRSGAAGEKRSQKEKRRRRQGGELRRRRGKEGERSSAPVCERGRSTCWRVRSLRAFSSMFQWCWVQRWVVGARTPMAWEKSFSAASTLPWLNSATAWSLSPTARSSFIDLWAFESAGGAASGTNAPPCHDPPAPPTPWLLWALCDEGRLGSREGLCSPPRLPAPPLSGVLLLGGSRNGELRPCSLAGALRGWLSLGGGGSGVRPRLLPPLEPPRGGYPTPAPPSSLAALPLWPRPPESRDSRRRSSSESVASLSVSVMMRTAQSARPRCCCCGGGGGVGCLCGCVGGFTAAAAAASLARPLGLSEDPLDAGCEGPPPWKGRGCVCPLIPILGDSRNSIPSAIRQAKASWKRAMRVSWAQLCTMRCARRCTRSPLQAACRRGWPEVSGGGHWPIAGRARGLPARRGATREQGGGGVPIIPVASMSRCAASRGGVNPFESSRQRA